MYIYISIYTYIDIDIDIYFHSYFLYMILPGLLWSVTFKLSLKTNRTDSKKYDWSHQSEFSKKINSVKHLGQDAFCSYCRILWWNSNTFHRTSNFSVSWLSLKLCFPTNSIFVFQVPKIGMSVLMQTSVANWFFGVVILPVHLPEKAVNLSSKSTHYSIWSPAKLSPLHYLHGPTHTCDFVGC